MQPLLRGVVELSEAGLTGVGATGAYHARGVAPLMHRRLPLNAMVEGADLAGTVLRGGVPSNAVILARLRDAFADPPEAYPIPGHPLMHPAAGAPPVVSASSPIRLRVYVYPFFADSYPCPFPGRPRHCLSAARPRRGGASRG